MSTMYQQTPHLSDVAAGLIELLEAASGTLELKRVYKDEPPRVDAFPSAAVAPLRTRRQLNETGMMYTMQHELIVYYYFAKIVTEDKLATEAMQRAERIVDEIIARDPVTQGPQTLNGLVFNLVADQLENGTVRRGGAKLRTVRINVSAQSRVLA